MRMSFMKKTVWWEIVVIEVVTPHLINGIRGKRNSVAMDPLIAVQCLFAPSGVGVVKV